MNAIEVKIPKDIRQYKESIFFGLSARQFFCSVIAVLIAVAAYMGLGKVISKETASWLCIVLAAPAAMAGFFTYNGMTFEQFLWAVIKSEILCAGERRFESEIPNYGTPNRRSAPNRKKTPHGKAAPNRRRAQSRKNAPRHVKASNSRRTPNHNGAPARKGARH